MVDFDEILDVDEMGYWCTEKVNFLEDNLFCVWVQLCVVGEVGCLLHLARHGQATPNHG